MSAAIEVVTQALEQAPQPKAEVNRGHPHKSTTHEEQYFHIGQEGTVFFRKEHGLWAGSVAYRDPRDQFNKRIGRNLARRKWFGNGPHVLGDNSEKVVYEDAVEVFNILKPIKYKGEVK